MAAVGTAAMWSFEDSGSDDTHADVAAPGTGDATSNTDEGPSVIDIATAEDDPEGDDYAIRSGTIVADTMTGTALNEFLEGHDGDDTLSSGAGDDVTRGGYGNDNVTGDAGDDTLRGNAGDDTISGGDGQDHVYGHEGNDVLRGGAGDDSIVGGEGDDTLTGDAGDDALHGYLGNDALDGDAGADTLFGGAGSDTLTGATPEGTAPDDDQDYLNGGGGDDHITLGAGDIATGGNGADNFFFGDWLDADHQGQIMDFATAEDSLVLLYDDAVGTPPTVSIEQDPEQEQLHRVRLDGAVVAQVLSDAALTLDHITLIPQDAT